MPLLSPFKNLQPEDWILIVSPGCKEQIQIPEVQGVLSLYMLRYDAYAYQLYAIDGAGNLTHKKHVFAKEPSPFSIMRGRVYSEGFLEDYFSYRSPAYDHCIFTHAPFAIIRGKSPVEPYEHRRLLRQIVSTYSHVFHDKVLDVWYERLCYWD